MSFDLYGTVNIFWEWQGLSSSVELKVWKFCRSFEHGQARRETDHDLRVMLLSRFPGRDAGQFNKDNLEL